MTLNRHTFEDRKELAETLAGRVAAQLQAAIGRRGRATMAVSGGTTPKLFFKALSAEEIAWDQVTVTLVDERFVPETSERSNQRLVVGYLLQKKAARARFVPLYNGAASPELAADHASGVLAQLPRPFDVVALGMGTDGHTASFFPEGDRLAEAISGNADRPVLSMNAPAAAEPRLTLTLPWIVEAELLVLHIESEEKRKVLEQAEGDGPAEEMPIRSVLRGAETPVELYWAP